MATSSTLPSTLPAYKPTATGAQAANITEQYVREAPDIEAYKVGLLKSAQALGSAPPNLPDYKIAGMSQDQQNAMGLARAGIGAYSPYLQGGAQSLTQGTRTLGEAANVLRGSDTRGQFGAAQQAMNSAAIPTARMGQYADQAGAGLGYLGQAGRGFNTAQQMALQSSAADLGRSQNMMMQGALQGQMAARQPGFNAGQNAVGMGIGSLAGAAQQYDPNSVNAFMNPYNQAVLQQGLAEINRQGAMAGLNQQAQAVKAGAFGGSREGVQRAEMERNLSQTRNQAISNMLQQGYNTAQQNSMQAFQNQQANQLAQGQGLAQAGATLGNLAGQQGQLGLQAAQNTANIGQNIGAQNIQQAGLGQSAANLYGQMAGQQGNLAGQYANIAGQQANILGQQSQQLQNLGQGIGNLANQQFSQGLQTAQGLGSLGTQIGNAGVQQAALGQTAQQLGQQDVNFLYNTGAQQQKQYQNELDATRATQMQNAMQPYQNIAFVSDIYKGAPSSTMAVTQQAAATPSPFQQAAGLATGLATTAGVANKAGIL